MTYCMAWKTIDRIIFISDSAVSCSVDDGSPKAVVSTFGETQGKHDDGYIYEGHVKIYALSDNIVISYSGNIENSLEIIQMIKNCLECGIDLITSLTNISKSVNYTNVDMLIGFKKEEKLILLKFDCNQIIEDDFFEIGCGTDYEFWTESVKKWFNYKSIRENPEHILARLVSVFQLYSIEYNFMPKGFGGTFTGLELCGDGIKWCKDITYLLLLPNGSHMGFITTLNRNGAAITLSTFNSEIKVMRSFTEERDDEYIRNNINKFIDELDFSDTDYMVVFNFFHKKATIIYINKSLHNVAFRLWRKDRKKEFDYLFVFGGLIDHLLFSQDYEEDEEMLVHFFEANSLPYISLVDFIKFSRSHLDLEGLEDYF